MEIYENIRYYKELPSTNEYAISVVSKEKVPEFTVFVAENQTNGKGQRGNVWETKKGKNLTFSIIIYPIHIRAVKQFIISECIALAVQKVVSQYCNNVTLKWPNDIYIGENKVGGILIENTLCGNTIASSVIGVGLNCNQESFSSKVPHAISIKQCVSQDISLQQILADLLQEFYMFYSHTDKNPTYIHSLYHSFLYQKDRVHTYKDNKGVFNGTIRKVSDEGIISIVDENKLERKYAFKEVQFLLRE